MKSLEKYHSGLSERYERAPASFGTRQKFW
jgi:hypothetical protein